MLILTRHPGESVDVIDARTGENLATVRVMHVRADGCVRLGFDAGPRIQFLRDNAKDRFSKENER